MLKCDIKNVFQFSWTRTCHERSDRGLMSVLKISTILLASFSVFSASVSLGFIQATLEPHMRQFNLSPLAMGKFDFEIYWRPRKTYGLSAVHWLMVEVLAWTMHQDDHGWQCSRILLTHSGIMSTALFKTKTTNLLSYFYSLLGIMSLAHVTQLHWLVICWRLKAACSSSMAVSTLSRRQSGAGFATSMLTPTSSPPSAQASSLSHSSSSVRPLSYHSSPTSSRASSPSSFTASVLPRFSFPVSPLPIVKPLRKVFRTTWTRTPSSRRCGPQPLRSEHSSDLLWREFSSITSRSDGTSVLEEILKFQLFYNTLWMTKPRSSLVEVYEGLYLPNSLPLGLIRAFISC